jgi:hypothetical protein
MTAVFLTFTAGIWAINMADLYPTAEVLTPFISVESQTDSILAGEGNRYRTCSTRMVKFDPAIPLPVTPQKIAADGLGSHPTASSKLTISNCYGRWRKTVTISYMHATFSFLSAIGQNWSDKPTSTAPFPRVYKRKAHILDLLQTRQARRLSRAPMHIPPTSL